MSEIKPDTRNLVNQMFHAIQQHEGKLLTECHEEICLMQEQYRDAASSCEKIADTLAIDAMEWVEKKYSRSYSVHGDKWVDRKTNQYYTSRELLQLFKDETGR